MSNVNPPAPRSGKVVMPPEVSAAGEIVAPPPAISPMAPYGTASANAFPAIEPPPRPKNGMPAVVVADKAAAKKVTASSSLPQLGRIALKDVNKPSLPATPAVVPAVLLEEEEPEEITESAVKAAPPFLVSMLVHMVLLVLLALITVSQALRNQVELSAIYADREGLQLLDDQLQSPEPIDIETIQPELATGLTPVENPFAAPPNVTDFSPNALLGSSTIDAPTIGLALTGREAGTKKALLAIYGATATTESSVVAGLEWLKRQQMKDGGWSLVGPYPDGAQFENRCAATAMALLAFQGYGSTHLSSGGQTPDFHDVVDRGWKFLLKMQDKDGQFEHEATHNQRTYAQAQATIAVCEIYGMTKDERFKRPAQLALDYAHKTQSPEFGGWRYEPRIDSDTSVTGWYVMALQSGLMAGLEVQSPNLDAISKFLDRVSVEDGTQYCYTIDGKPSLTMTAEAMLCRQYLGWKHDDRRLRAGIDQILANRIDYDDDMNVYYWYYATQACHHMDGKDWDRWNEVMREKVPAAQVKTGSNRGSWNSNADRWGSHGGRMYVTCLSVFMLESYYRHLPIYKWRVK